MIPKIETKAPKSLDKDQELRNKKGHHFLKQCSQWSFSNEKGASKFKQWCGDSKFEPSQDWQNRHIHFKIIRMNRVTYKSA